MGIFKPESKGKGKSAAPPTLRQQAIRYVERGEYVKAIAAYETLLSEELDKAAIYNIIGDLYEKTGNSPEAFEEYDLAIAEYVKEDQYRNAIGVAKKVLRYHKDRVEMYKRLADLYAQEGRVGDAILALNQYAEQMKGTESAHIVAEIKGTIAQLKEKSLLVQSAVDLGREEEAAVFPPPLHEEAPTPQVAVDSEEEARRLEEERLVQELEEEIERELVVEKEKSADVQASRGPAEEEAPSVAAVAAPPPAEEKPRPKRKPAKSEEEEALEDLVEQAMQASHGMAAPPAEERGVQEAIPLEAEAEVEVARPAKEEAPTPRVEGVAAEEAGGVSFLTLEELDVASSLTEGAVFAELSSKPYDSEHFKSRFEQEVSRSDRYGRTLSFILVQMGFLKRNHKSRGGKKSSPKVALVRKVGDCIRSTLRDTDILAYNSDGRIVLMLPETAKEGALFVAQRLKERITDLLSEQDYEDEAERLWLGVMAYPKDARSKEELMRRAQRMMELGEEKEYAGNIVLLPD